MAGAISDEVWAREAERMEREGYRWSTDEQAFRPWIAFRALTDPESPLEGVAAGAMGGLEITQARNGAPANRQG